MIPLVVLGGTGDVYLVSALIDSFRRHHGHGNVEVVLKHKFAAVAQLFPGVRYRIDDPLVSHAEGDMEMQHSYDNMIRPDGTPFYTHPCFERSRVRVDHMTTKPDASQADMYRMLLRVPPDAPLSKPMVPKTLVVPDSVLLIPKAVSWPNDQPMFWDALEKALRDAGRIVTINDETWPLDQLFHRCAASEWVIGPQCGVMSILCTGEFPCRKTIATPSVDDERQPGFLAPETYPYAYVTKFANDDYDVEEHKITLANRAEIVDAIVNGPNFHRVVPNHDPRPVTTLMIPMTPGDALDRLAVLTVKRDRFSLPQRASVEREYRRHLEATRRLRLDPKIEGLFARMVTNHETSFDRLERMVPSAINRMEMSVQDHVDAVSANRARIELKQEVDVLCRAPYSEIKSYYTS